MFSASWRRFTAPSRCVYVASMTPEAGVSPAMVRPDGVSPSDALTASVFTSPSVHVAVAGPFSSVLRPRCWKGGAVTISITASSETPWNFASTRPFMDFGLVLCCGVAAACSAGALFLRNSPLRAGFGGAGSTTSLAGVAEIQCSSKTSPDIVPPLRSFTVTGVMRNWAGSACTCASSVSPRAATPVPTYAAPSACTSPSPRKIAPRPSPSRSTCAMPSGVFG